jgi:hypothetical protein
MMPDVSTTPHPAPAAPKPAAATAPKPVAGNPQMNASDLDAITKAPTSVDSVIATVRWLRANHTIPSELTNIKNGDALVGLIVKGLEAQRAKLEPALVANVHN